MKRTVCVLLACAGLALAGCGSDNSGTNKGAKNVNDVFSSSQKDSSAESSSASDTVTTTAAAESSKPDESSKAYEKVDTDLSKMSSTMAYAEASNMLSEPDKYKGKIVKAKGVFAVSNDNGNTYFACMLTDAAACCSQPIEFVLSDTSRKYPADYPELDSEITVVGVFGTYNEGANQYCRLSDAQLL